MVCGLALKSMPCFKQSHERLKITSLRDNKKKKEASHGRSHPDLFKVFKWKLPTNLQWQREIEESKQKQVQNNVNRIESLSMLIGGHKL